MARPPAGGAGGGADYRHWYVGVKPYLYVAVKRVVCICNHGTGRAVIPKLSIHNCKRKQRDYSCKLGSFDLSKFEGEKIGWYNMVTRYASPLDIALLYLGVFCSIFFGASMPAFCVGFGGMVDGVGAGQGDDFSSL